MPRATESSGHLRARTSERIAALAVLTALTLAVFLPAVDHEFVNFDDGEYVTENAVIRNGWSWPAAGWAIRHAYAGTGGPITWASHLTDVELFGLDPAGHHASSIALHLLAVLLLAAALTAMTGAVWRSATVAALFAIHPLHVESVAWVAERKDVLSAVCLMATALAYRRYAERPSAARYAVLSAAYLVGLLSKPTLVAAPLLLLCLDVWPLRRLSTGATPAWALLREKLPLVAAAAVVGVLVLVQQGEVGALAGFDELPMRARVANALVTPWIYLGQTVWPEDLAVYYPYPAHIPSGLVVAAAVALAAVTTLAWRWRRSADLAVVSAGWFWYLAALAPVSGLLQAGGHARADRFTYLPLIGIFLMVVWAGWRWVRTRPALRPVVAMAAIAVVVAAAVAARAQVAYWRDSETLWRRALAVTTDNDRAHANLGVVYADSGRTDAAIEQYLAALQIEPAQPMVHNNLGLALARTARPVEAEAHYREAIRLRPDYARAHHHLGVLLAGAGRLDEAYAETRRATELAPDLAEAHVSLAMNRAAADRPAEALPHIDAALRLEPDRAEWFCVRARILVALGRVDEAREAVAAALRVAPAHAQALEMRAALSGRSR